jgi:phosphoglycerate dehydrogenase-like enzyme
MSTTKIVVWDKVGNVMWGVRPWHELGLRHQARLLLEDPQAMQHAPSLDDLFKDIPVNVVHVHSVEELDGHIADTDFLITHKVMVPPEVLAKGKRLRLVQHLGWDVRGIPLDVAAQLGVPVAATPLVNYLAVAEHAWALLLDLAKKMYQQRLYVDDRTYEVHGWGMMPGILMMRDMTLGLLGFGEIARAMAKMAHAFGMRCLYWDIVRFPELEAEYHVEYVSWEELFGQADAISVQLALNEKTEKIIGQREFSMMKPNAFLINTARGKLVDQPALLEALRSRRIGGAGLDVCDPEPMPADDPMHELHMDPDYNVVLTAHTAWQSHWTHIRDSLEIWHNVLRVLRGEAVHHLVQG